MGASAMADLRGPIAEHLARAFDEQLAGDTASAPAPSVPPEARRLATPVPEWQPREGQEL
jgi:hypothetical protein